MMPKGGKPKVYPRETVAAVQAAYAEGRTQAEIATAMGITQKIVWNLMRRHGLARRIAAKRDQRGQKNASWKGDAACYTAFHHRLTALFGSPRTCEDCNTTTARHYDWANLTGNYADPTDYRRLCRSCHWRRDKKIENIWKGRKEACP